MLVKAKRSQLVRLSIDRNNCVIMISRVPLSKTEIMSVLEYCDKNNISYRKIYDAAINNPNNSNRTAF